MNSWQKIWSVMVLIPFFFSVSGILIIHSHCLCTGKSVTALYLNPETCHSSVHAHLWFDNTDNDSDNCCTDCSSCGHSGDHDCGCESPKVEYLKISNDFNEERSQQLRLFCFQLPVFTLNAHEALTSDLQQAGVSAIIEPPPIPLKSGPHFIWFICQPKLPDLS